MTQLLSKIQHQKEEKEMQILVPETNISLVQAPKHIKESNSNQQSTTELRRSSRVHRVTLKYLEGIKAELRDPDEDE